MTATLWPIVLKTIVVHTITYSIVGAVSLYALDYSTIFEHPALRSYLHPIGSAAVAAGPLVQPLRGFLFGVVFYLLRDVLFPRQYGWLVMWITLAVLGIVSTFGPVFGSIEGLIYTTVPVGLQLTLASEILVQALLLSLVVHYWVRKDISRWLERALLALFVIVLSLSFIALVSPSSNPLL